jgi:antitoxin (DNA-binding transcriptional repressor) of toxin-antitoxin stability system
MKQVNMLEAKTHLSRLIADIEEHREEGIIIARNGRPVARLETTETTDVEGAVRRIGAARGAFEVPDDIDTPYGDLAHLFGGAAGDRSDPS